MGSGDVDAAMHDAVPAIVAAGASPLVRIAGMESWMVKRELFLYAFIMLTSH